MQRDDEVFAVVEIAAHPFDLVGIDVGRRHLDRRRQVEDQLVVRRRLDDLGDRIADLQRHFEFGAGEALRRIFEAVAAAGLRRHVGDHLGGIGGDLLDAGDVLAEHDAALQFAGRIVEMHDRLVCALQRLEGARDQLRPALHQHLQRHVDRARCPASTHQRAKSKSVCEAEGKPISISLKPMSSSRLNMRALRSWPIGSISAWLPSRRSTEHQTGGLVMTLSGQVRSLIGDLRIGVVLACSVLHGLGSRVGHGLHPLFAARITLLAAAP